MLSNLFAFNVLNYSWKAAQCVCAENFSAQPVVFFSSAIWPLDILGTPNLFHSVSLAGISSLTVFLLLLFELLCVLTQNYDENIVTVICFLI